MSNSSSSVDDDTVRPSFIFPPPPRLKFLDSDESGRSEDSDVESAYDSEISNRNHSTPKNVENLPPIGFFWDIENCQVPKNCSAIAVVSSIRSKFLVGRREAEFIVVCDTRKETQTLLQDLNNAQVNLLHVCSTQKNAADDKLRQCMRRYAELHAGTASTRSSRRKPAILLISGDVNFAADLSDFRYRRKMEVILVHSNNNSSKVLISCANEYYNFASITCHLPRSAKKTSNNASTYCLTISNLPMTPCSLTLLTKRLKQLTENCGGKITSVNPPNATVRYQTYHHATRALKRMDGEDVFGHKIRVYPTNKGQYYGIRSSNDEGYQTATGRSASAPLAPIAPVMPPMPTFAPLQPVDIKQTMNASWNNKMMPHSCSEENINRGIQRPTPRTPLGFRSIRGTHGKKTFNGYPDYMQSKMSPSPSPVPSLSPGTSVTPSPSPSPTMIDGSNWNASDHSVSEPSDVPSSSPFNAPPYVDISVTNLDHSADPVEVRSMLQRIFSEHVSVLEVSIRGSAESLWARVRVCGMGAAQLAVARLHRRRVAGRRLLLSLAPPPTPTSLPLLRYHVALLLQAAPDQTLPLFRLRELYANKHGRPLPASEVARLKDICQVVDSPRGRSVKLIRPPPGIMYPVPSQMQNPEWWTETDVCKFHGSDTNEDGETIPGGIGLLPVYIDQSALSQRIHLMITEHGGGLLLNCFPRCYQAHFGEVLSVDQNRGVPLEHLISCLRSVIVRSASVPKAHKIILSNPSPISTDGYNQSTSDEEVPGSLASLRTLLARELLDLLRTVPRCQMPFSRLIPSYHLHFGRQCRVADYGFTRLADLLDALSHTVQVMGEGSGRVITLSHAAQMKRFTADLLKVLRAQPDKSLLLMKFPDLYAQCLGRKFEAVEYGACELNDLIGNVARYCVAFGPEEGRISLPRHRQTAEEVARMRYFAAQAAELLRHAPNCRLELSRFVPAYHTHFGRQLRVAHYGLPKVQDLFHAIPETVDMWMNEEGERVVGLRPDAARHVVGAQIASLPLPLSLGALPHAYKSLYGHALLPSAYGCPDLITLLRVLPNLHAVDGRGEGGMMVYRNMHYTEEQPVEAPVKVNVSNNVEKKDVVVREEVTGWGVTALLAYSVLAGDRCVSNEGSPLLQFQKRFQEVAGYEPPLSILEKKNCIKLVNGNVLLSPLWRCIGRLVGLQRDRTLSLSEISTAYHNNYMHPIPYRELGFPTLESLMTYCCDIWEKIQLGQFRVRPGISKLLPLENKLTVELLPSTPPGKKSGVWSTPPAIPCGPWKKSPAPPAPSALPLPAPQLFGSGKRRVRLAAQFDSPS